MTDSLAYATVKYVDKHRPPPTQKIDHPSVFIAVQINNGSANFSRPDVVGITPTVALVMRDPTPGNTATPQLGHKFENPNYKLIGHGCVFFSHMQTTLHFKSQLLADKTVETIKLTSLHAEPVTPAEPFPAILSMDLSTLQIKAVDDPELWKMQESPEARRYALGPGYTAIINPGAIGYVVSALQILYMLNPFRTAVLRAGNTPGQQLRNELRKLFWKLQNSHLPVDPLFWRKFMYRMEDTALGQESTAFKVGKMRSFYRELGRTREESFYDLGINVGSNWNRLEDGLNEYFFGTLGHSEITIKLTRLPEFLILHGMFVKYDLEADAMCNSISMLELWVSLGSGPRKVFRPSATDTIYQLHGVVILEDVKPTPRYLLYLRLRLEDRWILFLKKTVSNA
ncbi:uncharacterized protein PAC_17948 [Phialocephala subalpina]|uniref:Uncharacterized protein n=1 Tax=Phialocephala subalpina TaxID=576137 RepID=A0A1L7XSS2_9HELO|nr:uncharacterized protein PAC_17948 [Phialocephala subalpina]